MSELKGIEYLRNKLALKRPRVNLRYKYYEMKVTVKDLKISTPPSLRNMTSVLGWCGTAVDSIADRLSFYRFQNDNYGLNEIYQQNNPDIIFDSAILSALISSCSFIHIFNGTDGVKMEVIDGANATGVIDPVTMMLTEGYAVFERDKYTKTPIREAYFLPGRTEYYTDGKLTLTRITPAPYPLLVPVVYRPDAKRPFGHSRISRSAMDTVQSAMRTIKRSEISAEFYSFPQKYVVGTSQERDPMDSWKAAMSTMMEFTKDEDGDKPTLGQFQQQSMEPHLEQLRFFAGIFAGETGLTLDDLGFPSDNPTSSDAIKASHENLRRKSKKAQKCFSVGFLNAGFLGACLRDDYSYSRSQLYRTTVRWDPVFEPDSSALSGIGDAVIKINQSVPGFISVDTVEDLTGLRRGE